MTEPLLFLDRKPIATGAMNRSKYFLSFIAPLSLILVVIACGSETASSPSENQPDTVDRQQQASNESTSPDPDSSPGGNNDSYGSGSAMTDDEKSGESGEPVASDDLVIGATPSSSTGSSGSSAQQPSSPKPSDPVQDPSTSETQDAEADSSGSKDADPPAAQPVVDFAPDFHLASVQGPAHRLSDYRGNQPVVVVFYRAFW